MKSEFKVIEKDEDSLKGGDPTIDVQEIKNEISEKTEDTVRDTNERMDALDQRITFQ